MLLALAAFVAGAFAQGPLAWNRPARLPEQFLVQICEAQSERRRRECAMDACSLRARAAAA